LIFCNKNMLYKPPLLQAFSISKSLFLKQRATYQLNITIKETERMGSTCLQILIICCDTPDSSLPLVPPRSRTAAALVR